MSRFSLHRLVPAALVAVALASTTPSLVRAQDAFDAKSAGHLRDRYVNDLDTLYSKISALANAIPADKYAWRPVPGVRSVSEVLMHVASEFYYYAPQSVGGKPPANFGVPKEALPRLEKITDKAAVLAELKKSWAHTKSEMAARKPAELTGTIKPWGLPLDEAAFGMAGDLHEHLGQLITYARSVGVKPPWSK